MQSELVLTGGATLIGRDVGRRTGAACGLPYDIGISARQTETALRLHIPKNKHATVPASPASGVVTGRTTAVLAVWLSEIDRGVRAWIASAAGRCSTTPCLAPQEDQADSNGMEQLEPTSTRTICQDIHRQGLPSTCRLSETGQNQFLAADGKL